MILSQVALGPSYILIALVRGPSQTHVLAGTDARTCKDGCTYLRERLHVLAWRDAMFCLTLPQTLALFASNACPLCLKRLREKAPSLRIPFLPCSPHRAEGRRYHNSRPRGGVPNTSAQWLYPLVQPLFFPQEQEINCYRKKGWPKWQVFSRRMSNFAQKLERMLLPLFIILHQQENKRKYE